MNILLVNWSWYPSGGDWTYVKLFKNIFENNGHNIIPFSVKNEKNESTTFEKYFINKIDYRELNNNKSIINGIQVIANSVYSLKARKKLEILLRENEVDIAHFVNIHNYITPSIITLLNKFKIPIVWRVVDYKLICPNATLFTNGAICELCKKNKFYNCTLRKCKKKSILASIVAATESYFYRIYNLYKYIDIFSFQSEFTRNKFVEFGFNKDKTVIIPNPVDIGQDLPNYENKNYVLFFGRIEKYKGVLTLLKSFQKLKDIELRIIGDGPGLEECKNFANSISLNNVKFLGSLWFEELQKHLNECCFVIVPSEWYEPSPYSILQSFAAGKGVIGSNIGGIRDLIFEEENGMLFETGNEAQLAEKVRQLYDDKEKIIQFGMNARRYVETLHSMSKYYQCTIKIFNSLVK